MGAPGTGPVGPSGPVFDEKGDLNVLAFIPMELQGSIESFLLISTGELIGPGRLYA